VHFAVTCKITESWVRGGEKRIEVIEGRVRKRSSLKPRGKKKSKRWARAAQERGTSSSPKRGNGEGRLNRNVAKVVPVEIRVRKELQEGRWRG